jgi:hypothetical protein
MEKAFCFGCLFILAFHQKSLLLRTENPDVDPRTYYPQPIEFFTIAMQQKLRPVNTGQ